MAASKKTELKKALRSIRFTVWIYFAIFIVSILIMIWISFTFSLEATYRTEKTNDISSIASYILTKWSEEGFTTDSLDRIAHDNDTCVLIQDRYGLSVYSYDVMGKNCLLHSGASLAKYRKLAYDSSTGIYYAEIKTHALKITPLCLRCFWEPKMTPRDICF